MTYVFNPVPQPTLPSRAPTSSSRSTASIASAATTPSTPGRWATTTKEPPFFFQKNPDNIVTDGKFPYPAATKDVHLEIEMVVALEVRRREHPGRRARWSTCSATPSAST